MLRIVEVYAGHILDLTVDAADDVTDCVVLEKTAPRVNGELGWKDGFHLQFPNFHCEGWVFEYLLDLVSMDLSKENMWDHEALKTTIDIIDPGMAKKLWRMYGSAKNPNAEPYIATMFIREGVCIDAEEMFDRNDDPVIFLPEVLSVRLQEEPAIINPGILAANKPLYTRTSVQDYNIKIAKVVPENCEHSMRTARILVPMLSDERADRRASWMDIGYTLYCIGEGGSEACELWVEFSKRSEKFVTGECEKNWKSMHSGGRTIGSLRRAAQQDSPEEYDVWKNGQLSTQLRSCVRTPKATELDVAQVFMRKYTNRFLNADPKKDLWYEFVEHRWRQINDATIIKRLLMTEMRELFVVHAGLINEEMQRLMAAGDNDQEVQVRQDQVKNCYACEKRLRTNQFVNKIVATLKIFLYDDKFKKRLNENKNLFVCENGVLDLLTGEFRDGSQDDYMSFSCGIEYQEFSFESSEYQQLQGFLMKIFPNPDLKKYFLHFISSCLRGGNVHKKFVIGTGGGNNAKSKTFELVERTFGEYCIKFPQPLR
ncbi:MAG: PriCT-2 domain-containing protein [Ectothiorhodospiraceae bacterium]|nr:PriCT-2 domain-containing protein [Ectothiorhodospiraceae bacterium]